MATYRNAFHADLSLEMELPQDLSSVNSAMEYARSQISKAVLLSLSESRFFALQTLLLSSLWKMIPSDALSPISHLQDKPPQQHRDRIWLGSSIEAQHHI